MCFFFCVKFVASSNLRYKNNFCQSLRITQGSWDDVSWVPFPDPASYGLSLLLVLYSAPRSLSPGSLVFLSPKKNTNISKFQFDPGMHGYLKRVLVTTGTPWVKTNYMYIFTLEIKLHRKLNSK